MKLVKPSVLYKDSFVAAAKEIIAEGNGHTLRTHFDENNFQQYCDTMNDLALGMGVAEGNISETILWMVDDSDTFIGRTSIRHGLTDFLLNYGGHIGYIIAPAQRMKGNGTVILALSLIEAERMGIKRVLVTCDKDNIPSAKIIERNGGVLEDERYSEEKKVWKKRYWIGET